MVLRASVERDGAGDGSASDVRVECARHMAMSGGVSGVCLLCCGQSGEHGTGRHAGCVV